MRRGFCSTCGPALVRKPPECDRTAVAMGAFDTPTRTHPAMHSVVAGTGGSYDIADEAH